MTSGHYVSFIKRNGKWFYASDASIKESSQMAVTNQKAYLLFYEKSMDQGSFRGNLKLKTSATATPRVTSTPTTQYI